MLWSEFERFGRIFDPWREFKRMEDRMKRLRDSLGHTFLEYPFTSPSEFPAVNVWTNEDGAVVTTEIPGVDPQSIDISVMGKSVTLRGSRQPEEIKKEESYHRRERWEGQFSRIIELPFDIETNKVGARFSKGILYITLPRAEADKPRKIAVKSE
jgi:HSP20 family protein